MLVATKGRFPMGPAPNDLGTSRRHLGQALDASLRRLGIERIDLYQMHAWDALTPIEETLRFLDDAIRAGKIAYYGFSNYLGWQVPRRCTWPRRRAATPPVTLQPQYNLLVRDIEHEIVPACLDAGIGLLPWSPLGGGWLAGKYRRDIPPTGATRLGENPSAAWRPTAARNAEARTWRISTPSRLWPRRAASPGRRVARLAAGRPAVTSVILGVRTPEQLADNLGRRPGAHRRRDRRPDRGQQPGPRRLPLRRPRRGAAPPQHPRGALGR